MFGASFARVFWQLVEMGAADAEDFSVPDFISADPVQNVAGAEAIGLAYGQQRIGMRFGLDPVVRKLSVLLVFFRG